MSSDIQGILGVSLEKIREMVDVNTVIGDAVTTPDGLTTLIPVSKISYGFAAGGSDLPSKNPKNLFGGGSGAGINITPIAFIAVTNGDVKVLPLTSKPDGGDKAINMIPDLIDKVTDMFASRKKEKTSTKIKKNEDGTEISTEETVSE